MLYITVVLATSLTVGASAQGRNKTDTCYRYDVDGCSIPFQLPFFFKDLFTHSCARHDICYHCVGIGVSYRIDRATCDLSLRNDTDTDCKRLYLSPEQSRPGFSQLASADFKQRLTEIVDDHKEELIPLLKEELQTFKPSQSNPDVSKYFEFFDNPRAIRVIIKWIELIKDDLSMILSNITKQGEGSTGVLTSNGDDISYYEGVVENSICNDINAVTSQFGIRLDCQGIGYMVCHFFSEVYYMGVNVFGGPSYHDTPEFYCNEDFVPKCLPGSSL